MRWIWIDRMTEFESGKRARAVKALSLAEDFFAVVFFATAVSFNKKPGHGAGLFVPGPLAICFTWLQAGRLK